MAKEPALGETRELGLDLGSTMSPAGSDCAKPAADGGGKAEHAAVKSEPAAGGSSKAAEPAGARRTKKLVQVGQQYIDRSLPASPETYSILFKGKPEARDRLLGLYARVVPVMKKTMEMDAEILRQYDAHGYAVLEMSDDED